MAECTVEKLIDAPPDKVFEYAVDLRRAAERVAGIVRLEVQGDGPIGVGTRFRETRVLFKREATEEMEITRFDPPNGYTVAAENHGCRYETTFTMRPRGTGTEVVMRFAAEPLTLPAKVLGFLMRPMLKACAREMGKDLDDLARAIQEETAGSTAG